MTEWQTFVETGDPVSPTRGLLIERALQNVENSNLPIKKYIYVDLEGGEHACGSNLNNQVFCGRTREGVLVTYLDWMNANWPISFRTHSKAYDHYPAVRSEDDLTDYVNHIFTPNDEEGYLLELADAPKVHMAVDSFSTIKSTTKR